MKKVNSLRIIIFFAALTMAVTWAVIFAWEGLLRSPFYSWVERRYPDDKATQWKFEQRGEHFFISATVDVIVVTLLLRLLGRQGRNLRTTQERYRAVFDHASDGIGIAAAGDYRFVDVNRKFARLVGYTPQQLVSKSIFDLVRADGAHRLRELLDGHAEGEIELGLASASGAQIPASISFSWLQVDRQKLVALIIRDLSERRRLEREKEEMQRQLLQTSKLASIGELSAGLAHEINNPLNCITNFAQLLDDDAEDLTETQKSMVRGIIGEGARISKIVRDLLAFARRDEHDLSSVDIGETINTAVSLYGWQLERDGISIDVDVASDLPKVMADSSRLQQVMVNMISNARNALREKPLEPKRFEIKARKIERDGQQHVRIDFYDNGIGVAAGNQNKVFDPFFTTRRETGGTGLGLSVSFGIVQEYKGTIMLDSQEGRYCCFTVELPGKACLQEAKDGHSSVGR